MLVCVYFSKKYPLYAFFSIKYPKNLVFCYNVIVQQCMREIKGKRELKEREEQNVMKKEK